MSTPTSSISNPPTQSNFYNYLLQKNWVAALDCLEQDIHQAREWQYGIQEPTNHAAGDDLTKRKLVAEPIFWKRLPLHLACATGAPIGIVQCLIQAYPDAISLPDPHNGSLAVHLACESGASLQVLRILLEHRCDQTKAVDVYGRLPLHYAVLAAAPLPVMEFLVHQDPPSVFVPDMTGKTPLQYAHSIYPLESPVLGLLELAWM